MELSKQQMERLREEELKILRTFIDLCDQLDLTYFVIQGTLLGAVRHKGFIPWDDDIDVGMLRKDYNALLTKGPALLPEGLFLQFHGSDPMYPHGFAKLRNSKTAFIETASQNIRMNHGIYIDIFPFDYYPDSVARGIAFETEKLLLRYRIRSLYNIPGDTVPSVANAVRAAIKGFSGLLYPSVERALDLQDELYQCVKSGKRVVNNGSPWGKRERIPVNWLADTCELEFEGMRVKAPAEYQKYLEHVYGNYMTLPPVEQRVPHHYVSVIDFDHPYTNYFISSEKMHES